MRYILLSLSVLFLVGCGESSADIAARVTKNTKELLRQCKGVVSLSYSIGPKGETITSTCSNWQDAIITNKYDQTAKSN